MDDAFRDAILKFVMTAAFSMEGTVSTSLASDQSSVMAEMLYWSVKFLCCATIPSVGPRKPVNCNVVPASVSETDEVNTIVSTSSYDQLWTWTAVARSSCPSS